MSNMGCGLPYLFYPLFIFHPFSKSPIFSQNFCSYHYKFTLKMFLCSFTIILADSLKGKGIICAFSLPSFFGTLLAYIRNSLVVQWLGLGTLIATGRGSHTHTHTHRLTSPSFSKLCSSATLYSFIYCSPFVLGFPDTL